MNSFFFKSFLIMFLLMIITAMSFGQNDKKIENKLEKLYQHENFEKLEKKALKLNMKYPRLAVSNYYLSRLAIVHLREVKPLPNKKQWNYLRKASIYAKNIANSDYAFWQDSLQGYYQTYIDSWDDKNYQSAHLKQVVKLYSNQFKDTLLVYHYYFAKGSDKPKDSIFEMPLTDSLRTKLLLFAKQWVGAPYKYGGETPDSGFDCSGFVKYVYQSVNVDLPHNSQMQSQLEGTIIPFEEAEPGDLIFFGSRDGKKWHTQHAGIIYEYTDDEPKVIHCVSRGVSIDGNNTSWDSYWKQRILFVKRLPQFE